ncbi:hypothetical protein UACE39S_02105 [Ureibacillus acetophenoni]
MSNPRKQIILNEILFWKQNKLLPEQYCDFLMTLYSEGNELEDKEKISHKKAVKAKEMKKVFVLNSFLVIMSILLLVLLFTVQQITLLLLIVVGILSITSLVGAYYFAKKQSFLAPILQLVSALFVFGLSVKISSSYFPNDATILYSLLIANCILWLGMGILSKKIYFIISGSLGLIVLIVYKLFFN